MPVNLKNLVSNIITVSRFQNSHSVTYEEESILSSSTPEIYVDQNEASFARSQIIRDKFVRNVNLIIIYNIFSRWAYEKCNQKIQKFAEKYSTALKKPSVTIKKEKPEIANINRYFISESMNFLSFSK